MTEAAAQSPYGRGTRLLSYECDFVRRPQERIDVPRERRKIARVLRRCAFRRHVSCDDEPEADVGGVYKFYLRGVDSVDHVQRIRDRAGATFRADAVRHERRNGEFVTWIEVDAPPPPDASRRRFAGVPGALVAAAVCFVFCVALLFVLAYHWRGYREPWKTLLYRCATPSFLE